jgi:sec-independent protein translocase protein TatA
MPSIGPTEIIVLLVVALLVLGPKRLPDAGRAMGRSIREFKDGVSDKVTAGPEARADDRVAAAVVTDEA